MAEEKKRRERFVAELERVGEAEIRARFIAGKYGTAHDGNIIYPVVKAWLDSKEALRADRHEEETLSSIREANSISREANAISREANSLSRKALSNSRRANTVAIIAMILSAATAIIVTVIQFIF